MKTSILLLTLILTLVAVRAADPITRGADVVKLLPPNTLPPGKWEAVAAAMANREFQTVAIGQPATLSGKVHNVRNFGPDLRIILKPDEQQVAGRKCRVYVTLLFAPAELPKLASVKAGSAVRAAGTIQQCEFGNGGDPTLHVRLENCAVAK